MKATGIVRHVDDLGRVVLPKSLRITLGMAEGTPVEVFVEDDQIILKKYAPGCCLCGIDDLDLVTLYPEKHVCKPCIEIIVKNESKLLESLRTN